MSFKDRPKAYEGGLRVESNSVGWWLKPLLLVIAGVIAVFGKSQGWWGG